MLAATVAAARATAPTQSPAPAADRLPVPVEIPSGDALLRGRLFPAQGPTPLATLLIVPGWGGDPDDASGMGAALSARGMNVLFVNFRGVQRSSGTFSYANALADLGAALQWLRRPDTAQRFRVDAARLVLGGNSFGGGVAMAYAASDPSVTRIVSIVGADHGVLARRVRSEAGYEARLRQTLTDTKAPDGPVTFEPDALIREVVAMEPQTDLVLQAPRLANRAVLLIGGWNDTTAPIEREILTVYRALRRTEGADATILAYPDGHGLASSRERVADDIVAWTKARMPR